MGNDDTRVALICCDLIAIPRHWVDEAKKLIEDCSGIPPEKVMIACTHIHTGPCTDSIFSSEADEEYLSSLPESVAESVFNAQNKMVPAIISTGAVENNSLGFNRRYRMRDGSVRTNPGIGNPDIMGPAGPVDPEVLVILIRDLKGKVLGCIFNYSNHVDVLGGTLISSDYPGMVSRLFRERFGESSNLVYLNGACGDVNHIDVNGPPKQSGPEQSEMMAKTLFRDLLGIMNETREELEPVLEGLVEDVEIPLRRMMGADLEWAEGVLRDSEVDNSEAVFAREILELDRNGTETAKTVVQAIRVGETVFIGIPGEAFVEIGLEVKDRSPFARTVVAELANDYVGYLPTEKAFDEGGYEVRPARSSKVGRGTQRIIVEKALELANGLHDGC